MESCLQIDGLTKRFGDLVLFEDFSLNIAEGEKVGLIARNGMGKSTLLDIIAGDEDYNAGSIIFRRDLKVSYLVQTPTWPAGTTIMQACGVPHVEVSGVSEEADARLIRARQLLTQLEVSDFEGTVDHLSGGQQKRVALASALLSDPDFLILDEPTNHLDTEVTEWLEDYLMASHLTLLLVTHDRYLLDRVCNRIVEIEDRQAYSYNGSYSYYLEKREERLAAERSQRESDLNLYRKELDWMRRMPCARGTKSRYRKESFHELEERLKFRRQEQRVDLDVRASYIGNKIFDMEHLSKRFGGKVILDDFSYIFSRYEKLGIVGINGVGKTTFLRMLMGLEEPDSGTVGRGSTLRIGYYSQQGISFNPDAKVIDVVTDIADHVELDDGRKMSAGQFLQKFLFTPQTQYKYVRKLSGGEKRRLYLCTILMRSPNFLILDEPTNDLDIMTLQVLEDYLAGFKGCVITVSHDRWFMDRVAEHLFVFEGDGKVTDFPSSYSDWMTWKRLRAAEEKAALAAQAEADRRKASASGNTAGQTAAKPDASRKLTYKEKREMEQIEAELEQLEAERTALEAELNAGTLPYDALQQKSARIGAIIARNDEITMRWLELSEKS